MKSVLDAGREVHPDDLPPALEWEGEVWDVYEIFDRQWRVGFAGLIGLDFNVFVAAFQSKGWDLMLALDLLKVIEREMLSADHG